MNVKILKSRSYYFVIIVVLAMIILSIPRAARKQRGKVRNVIDSNTIELYDGRIVRYIGVDIPRLKVQQEGKWVFRPEPFAVKAREFSENLILNKSIRLAFDTQEQDQFGRVLAYCFVTVEENGTKKEVFINKALLEEGLGYVFIDESNVKHVDDFFTAQKNAQQSKKNIWKEQKSIAPKKARYFINERKIITGKIVDVTETRRTINLLFHRRRKSYPKVVIFKSSFSHFRRFNIDPKTFYTRKKIKVFGLIREYSGPEIVVMHPSQIEIID